MSQEDLAKALEQHGNWLRGEGGGVRANLSYANLRDANLSGANLRGANLRDANLSGANLRDANLSGANLRDANLSGANLRDANLSYAANLRDANLSGANLRGANLRDANLSAANLRDANLSYANLSDANLRDANLRDANLRDANLSGANLSGAQGITSAAEWLRANTKTTKRGCILAYKAIGGTSYPARAEWRIEPGAYLAEVVNPDRGVECACGVNIGTLDFVRRNYPRPTQGVWLVGIEPADIADVVVPFHTDGKFRAGRVRLIRLLTAEEISNG